MNVIDLYVPKEVTYLNEWRDAQHRPFQLPCGILDKGIPNCGATTLALEDSHKTIICSPRNNLIQNKHDQHKGALLVIDRFKTDEIRRYIAETECPKILVSYDSLPKVANCIADKSDWRVVVDEFQYVLTDSGFKSEVERRLMMTAQGFNYVTYLSATPILDRYLSRIDFFKDIPYYKLHWSDVEKVRVIRKRSSNPIATAAEIIKAYQEEQYPSIEVDRKIIRSTECVIFINSVKDILRLVQRCGLRDEETNLIMGNSEDNDKAVESICFKRGRLPLKGEAHKKFTFCTSTAFAGCDFYSKVASSFVISDPKRSNTTIDVATDLVQIAGRQRLAENPFRHFLTFVYKVGDFAQSEEDFFADLERRRKLTYAEIEDAATTADHELRQKKIRDICRLQKMCNFSETFTLYDEDADEFCFNELAYESQRYIYDLQKYNYANGITVRASLEKSGFDFHGNQTYEAAADYEQQMELLISPESFADKMKRYCEWRDNNCMFALALNNTETKYPQLKLFYEELGSDRIRALGYKEKDLRNEVNTRHQRVRLIEEMRKCFPIGDRLYSSAEIKELMNGVFEKVGVTKKGTITDLDKTYKVQTKLVKTTISTGKRENRYKIIAHPD